MVETDWREILSFSQRELKQADKDKLCENLSWMEVDDIELNFTDLKSLFRLSQDILKYKSEQVNNLMGELEKGNTKGGKKKYKSQKDEPSLKNINAFNTIAQQEEIIEANKDAIRQLSLEIEALEQRKNKYEENKGDADKESESSRDPLSEMNATVQLENEIFKKNRHIRKLLADVKILEEDNVKLKEKLSHLNNKLKEASQVIENLTEQFFSKNSECVRLKEALGKCEQTRVHLSAEIQSLNKEISTKDEIKLNDKYLKDVKIKLQNLKGSLKSHKNEIERLSAENSQLKKNLILASKPSAAPKIEKRPTEEIKFKELEDKLIEASNQIEQSANLIQELKTENKRLKDITDEGPDLSTHDYKNESDDKKEKNIITKLKAKLIKLTKCLQTTEELVTIREKELAEITSQLQLVQSEEGINMLLKSLKNKRRQLKFKDDAIKNLVIEVNTLNSQIDNIQIENEILRQKLNIPSEHKIQTQGIIKKYQNMKQSILQVRQQLCENENKLVSVEIENRVKNNKITNLMKLLCKLGYNQEQVNFKLEEYSDHEHSEDDTKINGVNNKSENVQDPEVQAIIKENEGLRVGLQEILNFLKDNSTTSSGILSLKCPSLEAICHSMDARHSAGWFAPHMTVVMDLKAALGGKDALLTALHESRKETFEIMTKLLKESEKSTKLEQKLVEVMKSHTKEDNLTEGTCNLSPHPNILQNDEYEFLVSDTKTDEIDVHNKDQIQNMILNRNIQYENHLKNSLHYFQEKFKFLYDKVNLLTITSADNHNKWSIQEEHYKAEIENLKTQLIQNVDDETSTQSPGLISNTDATSLQRKFSYLEESYRQIRTQNENIKNEHFDCKREMMLMASDYETHIHSLMLSNINLADKFRRCVPADLFWKQNVALNESITKYRNSTENFVYRNIEKDDLYKRLQEDKLHVLDSIQEAMTVTSASGIQDKNLEENIEKSLYEKQLKQLTQELNNKNDQIQVLSKKNEEFQIASGKIIGSLIALKEDKKENFLEEQVFKLREENKLLKNENRRIQTEMDVSLLKLRENQQQKTNTDIEINLLRHQILDLQSTGDNKAIIARLSGEILIAHLQASESVKKIERLTMALNKEKHMKAEAEDIIETRQRVMDYYVLSNEHKLRNMHEILQVFRREYQGSLPLCSIESYISKLEELNNNTYAANEKLSEIEDLRLNLMMKHSVYDQVLETAKAECHESNCQHYLKTIVKAKIQSHELELCNKKIQTVEQSRKEILDRCNYLEQNILILSQGHALSTEFKTNIFNDKVALETHSSSCSSMELQDILSEDESSSAKNQTFTIPGSKLVTNSQINKELGTSNDLNSNNKNKRPLPKPELVNVNTQTTFVDEKQKSTKFTQTDEDQRFKELHFRMINMNMDLKKETQNTEKSMADIKRLNRDLSVLNEQKKVLECTIQNLTDSHIQKDEFIKSLQSNNISLKNEIDDFKRNKYTQILQEKNSIIEKNKVLCETLKDLENEKDTLVKEYKGLLDKEREEYANTIKDLRTKIFQLQTKLDRQESNAVTANGDVIKETASKYISKITELDDKCFKLQSHLDECKAEILACQSELDRWKDLASERLSKMEQLSTQLKERHSEEVESYKAENQHWLSQLNDTQREHMDLRSRLTEQKALYIKQLADKDTQIEQLRTVVHNLKTQIMNMQTMLSVNDPSFDLSAIVEVEESSDPVSPQASDRLELKFESVVDFQDFHDDYVKIPSTSTAIWQEPLIERLRREKQLIGKQNAILRRQIKAVAARERRARLDAQNLKNQVFRISTSGNKAVTVESAALQNKIATLQAQLTSARRDAHSTVAIWDKWKRAQQTAERWQARYEEKCQEEKKLETSLNLTKSALSRLEKEKRVLLSRLSDARSERSSAIEKQDDERSEKGMRTQIDTCVSPPPVSTRALLDRIEAQQRRIAALEVAEKGNEPLISEYEKALAEITSLKGQVLKLESTLLESQIRTPINPSNDTQPELDYWKRYCDMLKEENMQLTLRVNCLETTPTSAHQQRVNDLEQTVLTLRGLVSKLQADQKSGTTARRVDSRPGSGRSTSDKIRSQLDSYRTEISNLKRTIQEKDMLLERSKEMLKIAAEREDELLKENEILRRRFEEFPDHKDGYLST